MSVSLHHYMTDAKQTVTASTQLDLMTVLVMMDMKEIPTQDAQTLMSVSQHLCMTDAKQTAIA